MITINNKFDIGTHVKYNTYDRYTGECGVKYGHIVGVDYIQHGRLESDEDKFTYVPNKLYYFILEDGNDEEYGTRYDYYLHGGTCIRFEKILEKDIVTI